MSTFYFETVAKQSEKLANNGETFKLISETAVYNYKHVIAAAAVALRLSYFRHLQKRAYFG